MAINWKEKLVYLITVRPQSIGYLVAWHVAHCIGGLKERTTRFFKESIVINTIVINTVCNAM